MSFQGYLDTIRTRTGLGPDDFVREARRRGLSGPDLKAADVISWLAADHGLGRGHSMAVVAVLKDALPASATGATDDGVAAVFSGRRGAWRATYDVLCQHVHALGGDTGVQPTRAYVGFTRAGRKFALVAPLIERLDIGLKLDPGVVHERLVPAGTWNSMVTHRATLHGAEELDAALLTQLGAAHEHAGR
ncbi:MAG TPA: DUF4287 domain-containing protein [Marmoricola sp.]|nr:DUF4287 domain-containing protein [Marmoricola sp.]